MGNYDRRKVAVRNLESILSEWFKEASPEFVQALLKAAEFDPRETTTKIRVQSNLCELDIKTTMPFEPGLRGPKIPTVDAEVHVEWALSAMLMAYVSVEFEGGGRANKEFAFNWDRDPGVQGAMIGKWIWQMEPVAPPEPSMLNYGR
jgi:hypothetical protein